MNEEVQWFHLSKKLSVTLTKYGQELFKNKKIKSPLDCKDNAEVVLLFSSIAIHH